MRPYGGLAGARFTATEPRDLAIDVQNTSRLVDNRITHRKTTA